MLTNAKSKDNVGKDLVGFSKLSNAGSIAKGILFIGDPHLSSAKPGRRNDNYAASTLRKLTEAAAIATELNLIPVILGDLIHRKEENSVAFISRIIATLRKFPWTPPSLDGTHGKKAATSSDADVEYLLNQTGAIHLVTTPGIICSFEIEGLAIEMYATPSGYEIPLSLEAYGADLSQSHFRILLTHHDMAFGSSYPGAEPLREIKGCDMLVNGHMHKTTASVQLGQTLLHCPGNIEPLSKDVIDHQPAVWAWRPRTDNMLEPHYLEHDRDCFDLTGDLIPEISAALAVTPFRKSEFASMLATAGQADAPKTDEAAILCEDLEYVITTSGVSEPAAVLLRHLAQELSKESADAASAKHWADDTSKRIAAG